MTEVVSLRNFDLIPSSYSIFDFRGEEIGRNYSFEFMDTHDSVIVYYTLDGEFTVEDHEGFFFVYLPLKVLKDRGTQILTYGVTTFFIGEKRFFVSEEEIVDIFGQMRENFREEIEAMEFLTPEVLSELVRNSSPDIGLLSSAYIYIISYAAWWILKKGRHNEWWDIRGLAEVLKGFKKPNIEGVDLGGEKFLREVGAMEVNEYREGLNSLRRLYTVKEEPENKKSATAVAFDALMKLYKECRIHEQ